MNLELKTTGGKGFFSCCSVLLSDIVNYININHSLPERINNINNWQWYKQDKNKDVTYDFFTPDKNINVEIDFDRHIDWTHEHQSKNFVDLQFKQLTPLVKKYFTPAKPIQEFENHIIEEFEIDHDNTCVLLYRGNDKAMEQTLVSYDDFLKPVEKIIEDNKNIKLLIQSDETEFIEEVTNRYPDRSYYLKNWIRHIKRCRDTVDFASTENRIQYIKYYLSITNLMSKCKHIICQSGNCSVWVALYRGNTNNIHQFQHTKSKLPWSEEWINQIMSREK